VPAPDVIVIPGGSAGTMRAAGDEKILNWVRAAHETSTWTTSVCTRRADPRRRRCAPGQKGDDAFSTSRSDC